MKCAVKPPPSSLPRLACSLARSRLIGLQEREYLPLSLLSSLPEPLLLSFIFRSLGPSEICPAVAVGVTDHNDGNYPCPSMAKFAGGYLDLEFLTPTRTRAYPPNIYLGDLI